MAERIKIQPFIGRIFYGAVVEIKTVNVDGGAHKEKNKGRSLATTALCPAPEGARGIWSTK
jgi:hypothetical protein